MTGMDTPRATRCWPRLVGCWPNRRARLTLWGVGEVRNSWLCWRCHEAGARFVAERIRNAVEAMTVLDEKGQRVPLTISIGLACLEMKTPSICSLIAPTMPCTRPKRLPQSRGGVTLVLRRTGADMEIPQSLLGGGE